MEALKDKRYTEVPVPENLDEYLNEFQLRTLRKVEDFGWRLAFIRRPLFQEIVPVVVSDDGTKHGVLEEDGSINMHHKLLIRD
jgi:hypothetical protein